MILKFIVSTIVFFYSLIVRIKVFEFIFKLVCHILHICLLYSILCFLASGDLPFSLATEENLYNYYSVEPLPKEYDYRVWFNIDSDPKSCKQIYPHDVDWSDWSHLSTQGRIHTIINFILVFVWHWINKYHMFGVIFFILWFKKLFVRLFRNLLPIKLVMVLHYYITLLALLWFYINLFFLFLAILLLINMSVYMNLLYYSALFVFYFKVILCNIGNAVIFLLNFRGNSGWNTISYRWKPWKLFFRSWVWHSYLFVTFLCLFIYIIFIGICIYVTRVVKSELWDDINNLWN